MLCNTLGCMHYWIGPASAVPCMGPSSGNAGGLGCYPTHYFLAARQHCHLPSKQKLHECHFIFDHSPPR